MDRSASKDGLWCLKEREGKYIAFEPGWTVTKTGLVDGFSITIAKA
jgi:hypothetical protein